MSEEEYTDPRFSCKKKILIYIEQNYYADPNTLSIELGYSRQRIHKVLNKLMAENLIYRYGSAPRTIYMLGSNVGRGRV